MRAAVSAAIGVNVLFRPFQWSGSNTNIGRFKAATRLAKMISELKTNFPAAQLHVISHSHGGNVVLYALKQNESSSLPDTLIFLSTPFLIVEHRRLGQRAGTALRVMACLLSLTTFVGLSVLWRASLSLMIDKTLLWTGDTAAFRFMLVTLLPLIACVTLWRATSAATEMWHAWSWKAAQRFAMPTFLPRQVLIVRTPADEASSALGFAQLMSQIATKLIRLVVLAVHAPDAKHTQRFPGRVMVACGSIFIIAFLVGVISGAGDTAVYAFMIALLSLGIVIGLPFLLLLLIPVVWIACVVLLLAAAPFGLDLLPVAIGLQFSVEATPPGRWQVLQFSRADSELSDEKGLSHFSHSDPRVIREISNWMGSVINPSPY